MFTCTSLYYKNYKSLSIILQNHTLSVPKSYLYTRISNTVRRSVFSSSYKLHSIKQPKNKPQKQIVKHSVQYLYWQVLRSLCLRTQGSKSVIAVVLAVTNTISHNRWNRPRFANLAAPTVSMWSYWNSGYWHAYYMHNKHNIKSRKCPFESGKTIHFKRVPFLFLFMWTVKERVPWRHCQKFHCCSPWCGSGFSCYNLITSQIFFFCLSYPVSIFAREEKSTELSNYGNIILTPSGHHFQHGTDDLLKGGSRSRVYSQLGLT